MSSIKFVVIKNKKGYNMTNLVKKVVWSGKRGTAPRTLEVTLLDDEKQDRSKLKIEDGQDCLFYFEKEELFRGIILKTSQLYKQLTLKAYDNAVYLANNKDSFTYSGKTLSQIFKNVCGRYDIARGSTADVSYKIPEVVINKKTPWDVLQDAMAKTYKAKNTRYYILSEKGRLKLLKRTENAKKWLLDMNSNITDYTYDKSLEKTKTRIKLLTKDGTVLATVKDTSLEKKIGIFQDVDTPDDNMTEAQLKSMAKSILKSSSSLSKSLDLSCCGIADVISGSCVCVKISTLNINRVFYVDSDKHTFEGEKHMMTLSLNFAKDINKIGEGDED